MTYLAQIVQMASSSFNHTFPVFSSLMKRGVLVRKDMNDASNFKFVFCSKEQYKKLMLNHLYNYSKWYTHEQVQM